MPFTVTAANEGHARLPEGLLFRVGFDFVTDEGCDFLEVEVGEQQGHDDLGGTESAHAAAAGRLDVFGAAGFHLIVKGLDGVAGIGEEFVLFLGAIFKRLGIAPVLRGVEGHRVLAAELVGKVGKVDAVDGWADLVGFSLEKFAEWASQSRARAEGRAAQHNPSFDIWLRLLV